ncbi:MAG: hypothetical protein M1820_004810 [Bogoriella megaspora]|nr:MAG: hypothetical protein M1820_004810 [Bogoriella megaspora]
MKRACLSPLRSHQGSEFPILPFLTPRLFAPWPTPLRRRYASSPISTSTNLHELRGFACENCVEYKPYAFGKQSLAAPYQEDLKETTRKQDSTHVSYGNALETAPSYRRKRVQRKQREIARHTNWYSLNFSQSGANVVKGGGTRAQAYNIWPKRRQQTRSVPRHDQVKRSSGLGHHKLRWESGIREHIGPKGSEQYGIFVKRWIKRFQRNSLYQGRRLQSLMLQEQAAESPLVPRLLDALLWLDIKKHPVIFTLWRDCILADRKAIQFLHSLLQGSLTDALTAALSTHLHSKMAWLKERMSIVRFYEHLSQFRADTLGLITAYCQAASAEVPNLPSALYQATMSVLDEQRPPVRIRISRITTFFVIGNCSYDEVACLYERLRTDDTLIRHVTWLQFAYFFASNGQYNEALEMLSEASKFHNPHSSDLKNLFLGISVIALRQSLSSKSGYHDNPSIIARIMDVGIPLSITHYNVIILNAIEAEDFDTALQTYNLLKDNGIESDHYTYGIMLKGCMSGFDTETFRTVHRDILDSGYMSNDFVAGGLLSAVYVMMLREEHNNKVPIYDEILRLYCEIFDSEPLVDLKIIPAHAVKRYPGTRRSTPFAVGIVLISWIRAWCPDRKFDFFVLEAMYSNFRKNVNAGHELIAPLVETTHVSGAFLYAFGESRNHLKKCLDIMKDMTATLEPTAIDSRTGVLIKQAKPGIMVWNILAHCFARNHQVAATERVLQLMDEHGIQRDDVTWSTLVSAYSRAQDAEGMVDAMVQREAYGFKMNRFTSAAVSRIKDRDRLAKALDHSQKTTAEAKPAFSNISIETINGGDNDPARTAKAELNREEIQDEASRLSGMLVPGTWQPSL